MSEQPAAIEPAAKRIRGRPFAPGNNANPTGRPKLPAEIKQLAQSYGPKAIQLAVDLVDTCGSARVRLAAAEVLLDRGYGKAVQHIEHEFSGDRVKAMFVAVGNAELEILTDVLGAGEAQQVCRRIVDRAGELMGDGGGE